MSKARGQRHAPACPGVPQRRARSARSGPDGACDGATCERDSLFLFSLIILFSDATRCNAASEKHFVDRLVLSKHVHTRFISCSRGGPLTCTALTVQNSQKGQLGCSWSTSIPDALPDTRTFSERIGTFLILNLQRANSQMRSQSS